MELPEVKEALAEASKPLQEASPRTRHRYFNSDGTPRSMMVILRMELLWARVRGDSVLLGKKDNQSEDDYDLPDDRYPSR